MESKEPSLSVRLFDTFSQLGAQRSPRSNALRARSRSPPVSKRRTPKIVDGVRGKPPFCLRIQAVCIFIFFLFVGKEDKKLQQNGSTRPSLKAARRSKSFGPRRSRGGKLKTQRPKTLPRTRRRASTSESKSGLSFFLAVRFWAISFVFASYQK